MTHPFHPLHEREFELVDQRLTWGEDRVYYLDEAGQLKRLPRAWTSLGAADPEVALSGGRSFLRVCDLLELADLVARLRTGPAAPVGRALRTGVSGK